MSKKFTFFIMAAVLVLSIFISSPLFGAGPNEGLTLPPAGAPAVAAAGPDIPSLGWGYYWGQYLHIPAAGFVPAWGDTTYSYLGSGYVYRTGGSTWFWAPITLPAGAYLDGVRLYYYDNSSSDIAVYLQRNTGDTSPSYEYIIDGWYTSGTPGYASDYISAGATIQYGDADESAYVLWVALNATSSVQAFKGVRLFYHLQISPAPATATFTDVPTTHPFFQYVEALYASRITSGYSGTSLFGPDDYVTRGQMAAFLARALGLQWY